MLLGKESYNDLLFRRLFWLKDEGKWEKLNLQAESSARRWRPTSRENVET